MLTRCKNQPKIDVWVRRWYDARKTLNLRIESTSKWDVDSTSVFRRWFNVQTKQKIDRKSTSGRDVESTAMRRLCAHWESTLNRTYEPAMGHSPSSGLGSGSARGFRDVKTTDPETEVQRPPASRALIKKSLPVSSKSYRNNKVSTSCRAEGGTGGNSWILSTIYSLDMSIKGAENLHLWPPQWATVVFGSICCELLKISTDLTSPETRVPAQTALHSNASFICFVGPTVTVSERRNSELSDIAARKQNLT